MSEILFYKYGSSFPCFAQVNSNKTMVIKMAEEINASVMAPVVSTPPLSRSLAFRKGKTHSGSKSCKVVRLIGDTVHFLVTLVVVDSLKLEKMSKNRDFFFSFLRR